MSSMKNRFKELSMLQGKKRYIVLGLLAIELLSLPAAAQIVHRVAFDIPPIVNAVEIPTAQPGMTSMSAGPLEIPIALGTLRNYRDPLRCVHRVQDSTLIFIWLTRKRQQNPVQLQNKPLSLNSLMIQRLTLRSTSSRVQIKLQQLF